MKLISSSPPPSRHHHRNHSRRGSFLRRLRCRVFSVRAAWWVLVAIVAVFAIAVFRMLRQALEVNLQ